jgi:hypothetical protein
VREVVACPVRVGPLACQSRDPFTPVGPPFFERDATQLALRPDLLATHALEPNGLESVLPALARRDAVVSHVAIDAERHMLDGVIIGTVQFVRELVRLAQGDAFRARNRSSRTTGRRARERRSCWGCRTDYVP